MEIKGIDVSSNNGSIDWNTVADYGMGFAILRVHQKHGVDSTFENNYKGCKSNGIPVGAYKYSYAKTVAQAEQEAEDVLAVLNGRGLDFPVFYDLEWSDQRQLGGAAIEKIAVAFLARVQKAGYKVGIYCNVDWYNNVLTSTLKKYDCWLAAYPANDNGELQKRLRPSVGIGWQYSENAKIPGIRGVVDRNVFYKDYTENEVENVDNWTKTKKLLDEQVGYLEKRSAYNLDSKSANAGYNNYTKYSRDVNAWGLLGCQGQPWCATYQFWICVKIFGLKTALEIMGNGFYNCNSVKAHAKAKGTWHTTPKTGALVIFRSGAHIGRVTKVTPTMIYTNEGNTSAGGVNHVEPNGGCVANKSYTRTCRDIDGYVWIDYGESAGQEEKDGQKNKAKRLFVGKVTADELNVRTWAGAENPRIKSYPVLHKNNLVDVLDYTQTASDGSKWYYIRIAGKYHGFVSAKYIEKV